MGEHKDGTSYRATADVFMQICAGVHGPEDEHNFEEIYTIYNKYCKPPVRDFYVPTIQEVINHNRAKWTMNDARSRRALCKPGLSREDVKTWRKEGFELKVVEEKAGNTACAPPLNDAPVNKTVSAPADKGNTSSAAKDSDPPFLEVVVNPATESAVTHTEPVPAKKYLVPSVWPEDSDTDEETFAEKHPCVQVPQSVPAAAPTDPLVNVASSITKSVEVIEENKLPSQPPMAAEPEQQEHLSAEPEAEEFEAKDPETRKYPLSDDRCDGEIPHPKRTETNECGCGKETPKVIPTADFVELFAKLQAEITKANSKNFEAQREIIHEKDVRLKENHEASSKIFEAQKKVIELLENSNMMMQQLHELEKINKQFEEKSKKTTPSNTNAHESESPLPSQTTAVPTPPTRSEEQYGGFILSQLNFADDEADDESDTESIDPPCGQRPKSQQIADDESPVDDAETSQEMFSADQLNTGVQLNSMDKGKGKVVRGEEDSEEENCLLSRRNKRRVVTSDTSQPSQPLTSASRYPQRTREINPSLVELSHSRPLPSYKRLRQTGSQEIDG